ncbi:hypothetical protein J7T55_003004 [Diaporthe amygdali]|uniref:uncharacterized protein n=1 Tax=Phomopsis amygdali TaxID=1214568 RepID=UPI0022FE40A6|nr:uncharacterized protein J7T55_003004 [Diaporthe amygdali]KAJ0122491.1 hypothetical protein J7T55_003004 [Diaporthe amygdali]
MLLFDTVAGAAASEAGGRLVPRAVASRRALSYQIVQPRMVLSILFEIEQGGGVDPQRKRVKCGSHHLGDVTRFMETTPDRFSTGSSQNFPRLFKAASMISYGVGRRLSLS